MTDFASAFKQGQAAAADAQRARESVQKVIDTVARQIMDATDQRILIALSEHTFYKPFRSFMESISLEATINRPREKAMYVSAKNTKLNGGKFVPLAKWSQAEEGFPCKLTFGKNELTCYDTTALEDAFEKLLSNSSIGEELTKLLQATE